MSLQTYEIRTGYKEPMNLVLRRKVPGGHALPFDLTGYSLITLFLHSTKGSITEVRTTDTPPRLTVTDAVAGKVRFTPIDAFTNPGDICKICFEVVKGSVTYQFPTRERDDIILQVGTR
jgi:hypothetical protein